MNTVLLTLRSSACALLLASPLSFADSPPSFPQEIIKRGALAHVEVAPPAKRVSGHTFLKSAGIAAPESTDPFHTYGPIDLAIAFEIADTSP